MAGYLGTKAVLLSTTAANVVGTVTADAGQFDTSLNVDGTVTADGLIVDKEGSDHLKITDTSSSNALTIGLGNTVADFSVDPTNSIASSDMRFSVDGNYVLNLAEGGDISFYEDTGTTAKLFWDASAESLGIGTSSPSVPLDVIGTAVIGENRTDATAKTARLGAAHYTTAEEPLALIVGSSSTSDNTVTIGGGTSQFNAATVLRFFTAANTTTTSGTERMRIDSSGNVGIGETAPEFPLDIQSDSAANAIQIIGRSADNIGQITFTSNDKLTDYLDIQMSSSELRFQGRELIPMTFRTNDTEAMRIDSTGNLLVGKTAQSTATVGVELRANGKIVGTMDGGNHTLNRTTSDGSILQFSKDNVSVGRIGIQTTGFYIDGEALHSGIRFGGSNVSPRDNAVDIDNGISLGDATYRWSQVYAANATINTSDRNEKQDIASLTPTEMLVAARLSTGFKNFKWKDAVAKKGAAARTHSGVIAQDVRDAFTAEGLDAGDYSMFSSDTWWTHDVDVPAVEAVAEVVDEDGVVVTEAVEAVAAYTRTDTYDTEAEAPVGAVSKTRLGVRYPELLSFVAAYNEQRFASIEARLTALEAV